MVQPANVHTDAKRDLEWQIGDPERFLDQPGHEVFITSWTYEERTRRSQRLVLVEVVCHPGSGKVYTFRRGVLYPISRPERFGPLPETQQDMEVMLDWTDRFRHHRPHPLSDGKED